MQEQSWEYLTWTHTRVADLRILLMGLDPLKTYPLDPSGKLTQHNYEKSSFIVSFPMKHMKHGDFPISYVNVYRRVFASHAVCPRSQRDPT